MCFGTPSTVCQDLREDELFTWVAVAFSKYHPQTSQEQASLTLPFCRDFYWQLAARLADSSERLRSLLLGEKKQVQRAPPEDADLPRISCAFLCFIWWILLAGNPKRVTQFGLNDDVGFGDSFVEVEQQPLICHRFRSLSLDWAVMESNLIET